ncbi:VgrG-related protein [Winogradskya humida]|uniref:Type IV secretion protein Rhs n=1 Tax=Winogradskya humida TaxID=113566 RepID=A0ABQ3ZP02_9ACTN|nr:VgrG-related protein [Actinoplanes humidus]GIE20312.1 type IV secretion protein Rhs [Actinoplanes humidus]
MSAETYTSVLRVEVGGAPLPDPLAALLIEGWVDTSVTVPSAFRLAFADPGGDVVRKFPQLAVGAAVKLSPVTGGSRGKPMLTGEVTGLELDADGGGRSLVVRGYDPGHRLLRNRRVEGYPNMTASDIVRRLAGRAGLRIGRVDATPTVYDLATQPNITDWDFLTGLARENDVRLFFDEDGKLQFTALRPASGAPADTTPAAKSPFVLEVGANTLYARAGVTASGQVKNVSVRGWDVRTKRALTGSATAGSTPDIKTDVTPGQLTTGFGIAELVETATPYTAQAQVRHAATALAHDVAGSFAELEVEVTGNPAIRPGTPVAVKGAGRPFEGQYTVTGARHIFSSGRRYTTRVTVSGRQFRSLYGLTAGGAPAPSLPGVVTALVSNIKDPMRMSRVKVRFPWLSDTYESDWCRIAQLGGVRGGGLVLPEVGDEVLVAFDRGSLEHPYVLAGLYNGVDKPTPDPDGIPSVDPTSGAVNWRSTASRSGHQVQLLDAKTRRSSGIRLRTGDGSLSVHLDETRTTVTVHSDGTVKIEGTRNVDIKAGGDLNLTAGRSVNISGGGQVNVRAGGRVGINAAGAVMLDAVGTAQIKSAGPILLTSPSNASVTAATVTLTGVTLRNGVPF